MNDKEDLKNWVHGIQRYSCAFDILEAKSWNEAQDKIEKYMNLVEYDNNTSYYNAGENTLWNEYKFLFLCQFLEHRVAEIFSKHWVKVKPEFISKLRQNKKADPDRAKAEKNARILSPTSLIIDLCFNLGGLIRILEKETNDFDGKQELLKKLNEFNKYRISFIHNSFNANKKSGEISLKEVVSEGVDLGKKILALL